MPEVQIGTTFANCNTWWGIVGPFSYENRMIEIIQTGTTTAVVRKSTDYGETWSELTSFFTSAAWKIDAHADWETPGDTGSLLHVGYVSRDGSSNGQFYYRTIDMASDSFTTTAEKNFDPSQAGAASSAPARYHVSISVNRAGHVGAVCRVNNTDAAHFFIVSTTKGATASFSAKGASKWSRATEQTDWGLLLPAGESNSTDDWWLVLWQDTPPDANTVAMNWYNAGAGTPDWDGDQDMGASGGHILSAAYKNFDAMVRPDNGKALVAIWEAAPSASSALNVFEADHDDTTGGFTFKTDITDPVAADTTTYQVIIQWDRSAPAGEEVMVTYMKNFLGNTGQPWTRRTTSQSGTWTWGTEWKVLSTQDDWRTIGGQHITPSNATGFLANSYANDDTNTVFLHNAWFTYVISDNQGFDFKVAIIEATEPTATGEATFTSSGFGWPKAAFLFGGAGVTAETIAAHVHSNWGAVVGRNQYAEPEKSWQININADDAEAAADTSRDGDLSALGVPLYERHASSGGLTEGQFWHLHWIKDGIKVNVADVGASKKFFIVLFGGDDAEFYVGHLTGNATQDATATATDVPFEADFLIGVHALGATTPASDAHLGVGFAANVTGNPQGCQAYSSDDAVPDMQPVGFHSSSYIARTTSLGGTRAAEITSWTATGFVMTTRVSSGSITLHYLAVKLPAGRSVDVGTIDTKGGSTGTKAYTGVGFEPSHLMLVGGMIDTVDSEKTDTQAGAIFFGMPIVGTDNSASYSWSDQDAVAESNTNQVYSRDGLKALNNAGNVGIMAEPSSLDSDGFTLNYTTVAATARKWTYLAIQTGDRTPKPGSAALTLTGKIPVVDVVAGDTTIPVASTALALTGQVPVSSLGPFSIEVGSTALTLAGQTPSVSLGPFTITVDSTSLTITGAAPTPDLGPFSIEVGSTALTLSGQVPTPSLGPFSITPAAGSLVLTGQVPVANVSVDVTIPVAKTDLTLTPQLPYVDAGQVKRVGSWSEYIDPGTSFSHTAQAGTNRLLVVTVEMKDNTSASISSVTFGGNSLTKATSINVGPGTYVGVHLWYLKEADIPAGSQTLTWTWAAAPDNERWSVATYENVDQSDPIGNTAVNTGAPAPDPITDTLSVSLYSHIVAVVCGLGTDTWTQDSGSDLNEVLDHASSGSSGSVAQLDVLSSGTKTAEFKNAGGAPNRTAMLMVELLVATDELVQPGSGSLTLTGQVPTPDLGPFSITPAAAALILTGQVPVADVVTGAILVDSTPLTLAGFAPVSSLGPFSVTPAAAALVLTGQVPTPSLGPFAIGVGSATLTLTAAVPTPDLGPFSIQVTNATLTLSGQVPTVSLGPFSVTPAAGALVLTGQVPIADTTEDVEVIPGAGALTLTGQVPVPSLGPFSIEVGSATLTLAGQTPTVSLGPFTITVDSTSLTITGAAPTPALGPFQIIVGSTALTLTGQVPVAGEDVVVGPASTALILTAQIPVLSLGPFNITPGAATLALTGQVPIADLEEIETIPVGKADLVLAGQTPISSLGPFGVTPDSATLTLTAAVPISSLGPFSITPDAGALALTGQVPVPDPGLNVVARVGSWADYVDPGTTFNHTAGAGTNRALVVTIEMEDTGSATLNWVKFGGNNLTKAVNLETGAGFKAGAEIWYLLDADILAGSQAMTWSWSNLPNNERWSVATYENVDQGDPLGDTETLGAEPPDNPMSDTIDGTLGAYLVAVVAAGTAGTAGSAWTQDDLSDFTEQIDHTSSSSSGSVADHQVTSAGTKTVEFHKTIGAPTRASLVMAEFLVAEDELVQPGSGSLTLTGQVPTVLGPFSVVVPTASLNLTGFAPVTSFGPFSIEVNAASLSLTGQVPVTSLGPFSIEVSSASLTLSASEPTATLGPFSITVPAGVLSLVGQVPLLDFITQFYGTLIGLPSNRAALAGTPDSKPALASRKLGTKGALAGDPKVNKREDD